MRFGGTDPNNVPGLFVNKAIAPKQLVNHSACTARGHKLSKLINRLNELQIRLSRPPGAAQDEYITRQTAYKTWRSLGIVNAPLGWETPSSPSLTEVFVVRQWANKELLAHDSEIRLQRIKRWKNRIQQSAKGKCAYIFKHLRNKQQDEPTNLVMDKDNNIVVAPQHAISSLNETWDEVYAVNVLRDHPLQMLNTVWPYIQHTYEPAILPPIDGSALFRTIQKRPVSAAPGLDGWRTAELQQFSPAELEPVAKFFAHIEDSDQPLPQSLVCAKQVILNKPGPATPLNKRLITILPALLLAYTGSRFAELQEWQNSVMPQGVLGGIRNRHMSTLFNEMHIDLDAAFIDNTPLVGLKLDKAKAFDRIVPESCLRVAKRFGEFLPQDL